MKWSATLLFFLLMSTSVMAFSEEVTSTVDDSEVQQVDKQEGVQEWAPVSLTRMEFKSEIPEVVVFDNHIRPFYFVQNLYVDNVDSFYFKDQFIYTGIEGSLAVIVSQRNVILICPYCVSEVSGLIFDANEREQRPSRNRPILCRS